MAAGFSPSSYTRFVDDTGLTVFTTPRDFVVDAQKNNYRMLGSMSRGQPMDKILQGGSKIYDKITLDVTRRMRSHALNEKQAYQITGSSATWETEWRFFMTDVSYPEETMILNAGSDSEVLSQMYKDKWHEDQLDMHVDAANYWEERYWAVPDKSKMEAKTGKDMYSVAAGLNEYANGLPAASDQPGGTWTEHQGIAPATAGFGNWAPTQLFYGGSVAEKGFDATSEYNILRTLDAAMELTNFEPPPLKAEYFTDQAPYPIGFIACSLYGKVKLKQLHRDSNDRWANQNDPWGNPMHNGVPIVYCSELNNAAIYPTGASDALSTELDDSNVTHGLTTVTDAFDGTAKNNGYGGARFYGIQPSMMRQVWHKNRFMSPVGEGAMRDLDYPTTPVMLFQSFGNLVMRSRKRHFILAPEIENIL